MKEIVICDKHGGFSLSREAFLALRDMGNREAKKEPDYGEMYDDGSGPRERFLSSSIGSFLSGIKRDDPQLIKVVKELGEAAAGDCAHLKIVKIPRNVKWEIEEYDGLEWVAEKHRRWS
jgi:hypothetical protein